MKIAGLQKTTLIDYPGRIAATVFLSGCNFRCPFCYSAELVLPEKIKNHPVLSEEYFFDFLKEKVGLLEAVVVCGGEPTLNPELPLFLKRIKDMGFMVKLDTNGSNPEMLKSLIKEGLVDYIAMDVKAPREKYIEMVKGQADLNKIEESIRILKEGKADYEFRTTVVPLVHTKEDILNIARWLKPAKRYFLQSFRGEKTIDPAFTGVKPYPESFLLEIKREIASNFQECQIR
ncbi:MAG: anaerobic ribonucleoside-triphosphate reductase activating protein [Candidatus Paceibacterota bacterium]|jgi:pyruvate formate lyase activating enzyme